MHLPNWTSNHVLFILMSNNVRQGRVPESKQQESVNASSSQKVINLFMKYLFYCLKKVYLIKITDPNV